MSIVARFRLLRGPEGSVAGTVTTRRDSRFLRLHSSRGRLMVILSWRLIAGGRGLHALFANAYMRLDVNRIFRGAVLGRSGGSRA